MRESKKELIVQIATKEFAKRGFEGTSLDDIAKEAGVTKAAIYYHFKDKAALYDRVFVDLLEELASNIKKKIEKKEDIQEKLECYIVTFGTFLQENPHFAPLLAHEFADNGAHISESGVKALSKTLQILTSILNKGIEKKVFKTENPMLVQLMIVSSLIMHQTTFNLRRRVASWVEEYKVLPEPAIDDIAQQLAKKIIKAIKEPL